MSNNYEIGYCKPPKATQFQPGNSGHKKGRPKGSKNTLKMFLELAEQKITLQENGETQRITKRAAALKQLLNKAMKGNTSAMQMVIDLLVKAEEKNEELENIKSVIKADDMNILNRAIQRRGGRGFRVKSG
jgi:hypothetical protein